MDLVRREFDKHAGEVLDELHHRDLIENNSLDEIPALYDASDPFSEDSDVAVDVHGSGSDDVEASREILAAVVQDTSDRRVTVTVEPGRRRAYAFDRTGVNSVSTIASHCSGPSGEPYIVCGQSCGDCSWSFSYSTKAYWKYPYPEDSGCYDLEYYGCNRGSCSESCF